MARPVEGTSKKSRIPSRRKREVLQLVADAHLTCKDIDLTGGNHIKLLVAAQDGREATFFAALTPSNRRSDPNCLSHLRRFAKGTA